MISLNQSIKEFLDSWAECSKCKYMFNTKLIKNYLTIKLSPYNRTRNDGRDICKDCNDYLIK